jgi:hypothetical protein
MGFALVVAGGAYIPLDLSLRRQNRLDHEVAGGPRRGLVLALLAGGIVSLAIGGAVALYTWVTALFGSPINNWAQVARMGLVAFIIGGVLVAIYLSTALRERFIGVAAKQGVAVPVADPVSATTAEPIANPDSATAEPVVETVTIESVLDELVAGKITRDEAANRIRAIGVA